MIHASTIRSSFKQIRETVGRSSRQDPDLRPPSARHEKCRQEIHGQGDLDHSADEVIRNRMVIRWLRYLEQPRLKRTDRNWVIVVIDPPLHSGTQ